MSVSKDTSLVKITIEINKLTPYHLFTYNTELPMRDNIYMVVSQYNNSHSDVLPLDESKRYGLKLQQDKKFNPDITEYYITEESFKRHVKDGYHMKLVPNVQDTVKEVFETLNNEQLLALSHDKLVIQEIVETGRHEMLIKFILNGKLNDDGESGALNIIYHLLRTGYIRSLDCDFVKKVVEIAQNFNSSSTFALSLIVLILSSKKDGLNPSKDCIMEHLTVPHVMQNFNLNFKYTEVGFFLKVFTLINYMIHCAKAEKRTAILCELSTAFNRDKFYRFLKERDSTYRFLKEKNKLEKELKSFEEINDKIDREIFVLQARLLTITYYRDYANQNIRASTVYEQPKRLSIMSSDYDLFGANNDQKGEEPWLRNLRKADSMLSIASSDISVTSTITESPLINKCLKYGRTFYHIYFDSLEKTDYSSDAELNSIAQNIIKLLTNLFCIGIKVHSNNFFVPVYFAPNEIMTQHGERRTVDFFEEVFVKTLMLLFRSKAEMKAKTKADFTKLYQVVNKQLKIIIKKRPMTFEEWDIIARDITNAKLQKILQEEREARWKYLYEKNNCLKALAEYFSYNNHLVIREQRYEVLCKGFTFPNMHYKKGDKYDQGSNKHTHFSLQLNPGRQKLWYEDHTEHGKLEGGDQYPIDVNSIKHIIVDKNCSMIETKTVPHNKSHLVFTIVYYNANNEKISLDCFFDINHNRTSQTIENKYLELPKYELYELEKELASATAKQQDELKAKRAEQKAKDLAKLKKDLPKLAQIWKDGLNLLCNKDITNNVEYMKELNDLNEMDCAMQLIELQDVEIPVDAPPIPSLPEFIT